MRYLTWKLEFVSNILSMIVVVFIPSSPRSLKVFLLEKRFGINFFLTNLQCPKMLWSSVILTVSWRRSLWYRNQSIDLQRKWFLYDRDLRHERVNNILRHNKLTGKNKTRKFPAMVHEIVNASHFKKTKSQLKTSRINFYDQLINFCMIRKLAIIEEKTEKLNLIHILPWWKMDCG